MSEQAAKSCAGMNFFSWLLLLFVGLKLTGYVTWSWLWVLSPLWIPLAVVFVILGFTFTYVMFKSYSEDR